MERRMTVSVADLLEVGACWEGVMEHAYRTRKIVTDVEDAVSMSPDDAPLIRSAAKADGYGYGNGYGDGGYKPA